MSYNFRITFEGREPRHDWEKTFVDFVSVSVAYRGFGEEILHKNKCQQSGDHVRIVVLSEQFIECK